MRWTDRIHGIDRARHSIIVRRDVGRPRQSRTRNRPSSEGAASPASAPPPRRSRVSHCRHRKRYSENDANCAYCVRSCHVLSREKTASVAYHVSGGNGESFDLIEPRMVNVSQLL